MPKSIRPQQRQRCASLSSKLTKNSLCFPEQAVSPSVGVVSFDGTTEDGSRESTLSSLSHVNISPQNQINCQEKASFLNKNCNLDILASRYSSDSKIDKYWTKRNKVEQQIHSKVTPTSRISRSRRHSGCLKSLATQVRKIPKVSEDKLSENTSTSDEEDDCFSPTSAMSSLHSILSNCTTASQVSSSPELEGAWGQFVDVIPLDNENIITSYNENNDSFQNKTRWRHSRYNPYQPFNNRKRNTNKFSGQASSFLHQMEKQKYSIKKSRSFLSSRKFSNQSLLKHSSLDDIITVSLCQMRM